MAARAFRCPSCSRQLWTVERSTDRRGRERTRIVLERNVDTRWRWFKLYAECSCGELVRLPESADVVHRN